MTRLGVRVGVLAVAAGWAACGAEAVGPEQLKSPTATWQTMWAAAKAGDRTAFLACFDEASVEAIQEHDRLLAERTKDLPPALRDRTLLSVFAEMAREAKIEAGEELRIRGRTATLFATLDGDPFGSPFQPAHFVKAGGLWRITIAGDIPDTAELAEQLDRQVAEATKLGRWPTLREQRLPIVARRRLNEIAKGLATYLNEYGDNRFYPRSLAELWDKKVMEDPKCFVSPLDPEPPKLPNGLACSYGSCFDRHPDRVFRDDFPPNIVCAWDRIPFVEGKRNVLYFDSHVEAMDEERFKKELAELDALAEKCSKRPAEK